jgi:hypothetical protein
MQTRSIVITAGAAVAAFAVAFGLAKATGGGNESKASTAAPTAKTIDVQTATISANVQTASLPSLKAKPKPKATATPEPQSSATVTPSTTSNTTPSTTTQSSTTPSTSSNPPADNGPVHGGGEH